ncbi:MAG: hypothetical protein VB081_06610 [Christensenella sp.]|uniref:hypothetical protein n=1 Tax=Christensenella sp. TaxID=1935934 RepID=UPI002B20C0C7|nr:hypothetical protein [Christensenella sp.]MEA5003154.1 hypothetical protein [Christensenella sp.]
MFDFTGCGSMMRGVMDIMDSAKESLNGNMHYEDKILGFSMEIPYEWEILEPKYLEEGGIAWFNADAEVYGRDDLQMAVLYIPETSYTQSTENLRDFMKRNITPDDNITVQIAVYHSG